MLNSPGNNGHSLGLSVGATNLAGTRDGQTAVIRPAELTLRGQRLTGFVDRVGDPVPLIAPDGSKYRSEELLADALGSMARAVTDGVPVSDVAVTVPAHWRVSVVDILRRNLRGRLPVVSDATAATAIVADLPGHRADIRVTRTELEDLMAAPLSEFLAVLDETRERYGVPAGSVSAVATVGGGARIPLITQRLSEHLRAPVVTTPHPQLTAAEGAALIAYRSRVVDTATALTPTTPAAAPTTATIATEDPSSALAWSEDDAGEDVLPYSDVTDSRPEVQFRHEEW